MQLAAYQPLGGIRQAQTRMSCPQVATAVAARQQQSHHQGTGGAGRQHSNLVCPQLTPAPLGLQLDLMRGAVAAGQVATAGPTGIDPWQRAEQALLSST